MPRCDVGRVEKEKVGGGGESSQKSRGMTKARVSLFSRYRECERESPEKRAHEFRGMMKFGETAFHFVP